MLWLACVAFGVAAAQAQPSVELPAAGSMVRVTGGRFVPLYGSNKQPERVATFELDALPVSNAEFLQFVASNARWQRGRAPAIFADADYLRHWDGPLRLGASAPLQAPVTNVSWFAARAYCAAHDKRLPLLKEWEYAARADAKRANAQGDPEFLRRLLDWYGAPSRLPLPEVGSTFENYWGVWDMHGLVWEWVEDFNSVLLTGATRTDGSGVDRDMFCAAGSVGSVDPNNYAAFMRYAFRSSTDAAHAIQNLGFRCARDVAKGGGR